MQILLPTLQRPRRPRVQLVLASACLVAVASAASASVHKVYWTDLRAQKIRRASPDGTLAEDVVTGVAYPATTLALDTGRQRLYWTNSGQDQIETADFAGQNRTVIVKGEGVPLAMALDTQGGFIYWVDGGFFPAFDTKFQRANLDGSNVETLFTMSSTAPGSIALDVANGTIYWTEQWFPYRIRRASFHGGNVEDLVPLSSGYPGRIALDLSAGKMYWTTSQPARIQRASLDGSGLEDIVTTGLGSLSDMALDVVSGKIYWVDGDLAMIQRANLDGSRPSPVVECGLIFPNALALDLQNPASTLDLTFSLKAVPNPVAVGRPFALKLDIENRGRSFTATISLSGIVGRYVVPIGSASGVGIPFGLSVNDVTLRATDQFPAGYPPSLGYLLLLVDESTGEILSLETKLLRVE